MNKTLAKILSKVFASYAKVDEENHKLPWYLRTEPGHKSNFLGLIFIPAFLLVWLTYLGFNYIAKITAKPKTITIQISSLLKNPSFDENANSRSYILKSSDQKYKGIIFRCDINTGKGFAKTLSDDLSCDLNQCNELLKNVEAIRFNQTSTLDFHFFINKTTVTCNF